MTSYVIYPGERSMFARKECTLILLLSGTSYTWDCQVTLLLPCKYSAYQLLFCPVVSLLTVESLSLQLLLVNRLFLPLILQITVSCISK